MTLVVFTEQLRLVAEPLDPLEEPDRFLAVVTAHLFYMDRAEDDGLQITEQFFSTAKDPPLRPFDVDRDDLREDAGARAEVVELDLRSLVAM